jgi:hypothetical protein
VRIYDGVRAHCARVAANARSVRIQPDAPVERGGRAGLDPELHLLDGRPEDVARYVLVLDALNFGSGWFDELGTSTDALTAALTAHGAREPIDVAAVFGLPAGHELTRLYEEALRQLDAWGHDPLAFETADGLARALATMPFYADTGFYKRAQITANDLVLAGVAAYPDADRLTIFADNLVPHVLRVEGMLEYAPELAARIDAGEELAPGSREEVEIRACAVHACELLAARFEVAPRVLDNWLWNRGRDVPGSPHRTRTTFY